jgi:NDP-sugar pyrophosphorylase family protein
MSVFHNEGQWDVSNVETDGAWVLRYEKGRPELKLTHIDYGALALRRDVIAALAEGEVRGLDTIQRDLAGKKLLRATIARDRFFEIGSPEGLATLSEHLQKLTSTPR